MITINGVPDQITYSSLGKMLGQLGIEVDDLVELHMDHNGIWAKVYARNHDSQRFVHEESNEVAQHIVTIELVRD